MFDNDYIFAFFLVKQITPSIMTQLSVFDSLYKHDLLI